MSRIFTKFQNALTMLVDCSHLLPIDAGLDTNFQNTCRNSERPKAGLRLIKTFSGHHYNENGHVFAIDTQDPFGGELFKPHAENVSFRRKLHGYR